MKILVTGGAGYIGSFMTKHLLDNNHEVVVTDSLERGHEDAIDGRATFLKGNLLDKQFVAQVFAQHRFDGVIHFAGYISMKESMQNPSIYFEDNVFASMHIFDEMVKQKQNNVIFSSTAGVYGNPVTVPIPENHQTNPTNSYGESKLMVEHILKWYNTIHQLNYTALRYFNAAGAALDGSMGERHEPETHIIPNAIHSVLEKKPFTLYGTDYHTPDGTCVRDYIHVLDLVDAHMRALEQLHNKPGGYTYNVGTGKGYSNKEVIDTVKKVSQADVIVETAERRPGDAEALVADASRIQSDLGFSP